MEKLIPKGFVTLSFMAKNSRPPICEVPSVLQSVYTLWTQSSHLQSSGFMNDATHDVTNWAGKQMLFL